jgi:hypothetical protein
MLRRPHIIASCLASCLVSCAWSQDAVPIVAPERVSVFDFEADTVPSSWRAADAAATLSITREKPNVAVGEGALEFAYEARPGVFQQISTSGFGGGSPNTLSLRVKAASPTSISLGVAEQDGAQYQGLLWVDAGKWVDVRAALSDLILAQDSLDDDGRLDADQVVGFSLADLANLPGEVGQALGRKQGDQRIWLDNVGLVDDAKIRPRGRVEKLGDEWLLVLDDFEGDVFWGLPIRQAGLKFVPGAPKAPGGRGLEITYTFGLGLGRWVGYVLAPPGRFDLSTAHEFSMWAKADLNARLVIVLEERDGTKYDTAAKVPPDGKWHPVLVPFDVFAASDPAADENGQLDAAQIDRVIILVDTFDADAHPGGYGSVSVDDVGLVVSAAPQAEGAP